MTHGRIPFRRVLYTPTVADETMKLTFVKKGRGVRFASAIVVTNTTTVPPRFFTTRSPFHGRLFKLYLILLLKMLGLFVVLSSANVLYFFVSTPPVVFLSLHTFVTTYRVRYTTVNDF